LGGLQNAAENSTHLIGVIGFIKGCAAKGVFVVHPKGLLMPSRSLISRANIKMDCKL